MHRKALRKRLRAGRPAMHLVTAIGIVLGMSTSLVDSAVAADEADERQVVEPGNPELAELYAGDQADRSGDMHDIDWTAVSARDAERRTRVLEIIAAGEARVAADYYHAAMVFQHGEGVDDIRQARDWARKAVELDTAADSDVHKRAKWLFAAATDRHLHRQGKPQIFGTQFKRDAGGPWTMEPFDQNAISAEEREAHGVPTIENQMTRLEGLNASLRERGLLEVEDSEEP